MRIAMIGQKGAPATHGGVERHVEELGARLVQLGHEVTVFTRPNYTSPDLHEHRGMRLVSLPTVNSKHLDAIVHSALASFATWVGGYDLVHYHAIGPCLASPIARLRGRRVVATIHGQDWRRGKWGLLASLILRLGERMALRIPHAAISVSESLANGYRASGYERVTFIPNGVTIDSGDDASILSELGIEAGAYVLFAGRLVPEKGCHYLIDAWDLLASASPLVIAGDSSASEAYVSHLKASAGRNVEFAGYVYGARLAALFRHCALFVLPSDIEGLPIVLLEALAYGAPVLASDIPPNVEVLGNDGEYFPAGDVGQLAAALSRCLSDLEAMKARADTLRSEALRAYDWDRVARETSELYETVARG